MEIVRIHAVTGDGSSNIRPPKHTKVRDVYLLFACLSNIEFWSSLKLVLTRLFSHQGEANSGSFYPKWRPLEARTMDLKQESGNFRKLYCKIIPLSKCSTLSINTNH